MIKNVKSEEGSVVLLALMVLLLITMFGFSALNNADTELLVAQNARCYKQNLYRAEGMVMEAAQIITASAVAQLKPDTSTVPWLVDGTVSSPAFIPEIDDWESSLFKQVTAVYTDDTTGAADTKANFSVVFEGGAPGSSVTVTTTTMWQYSVYGKSNTCNGEIGVVAGYRRRF